MTPSGRCHLAQANIATMRAALEDPVMEGFRSQLDRINALADASPGFVWRLQTEAGNATDVRAYENELVLFNMSVWESIEALHTYVYRGDHAGPLRSRRRWFVPTAGPTVVLWWIAAGHLPAVEEAKERFALLQARGPRPEAFTFRSAYPPPGAPSIKLPEVDRALCASAL